MNRENGNTVHVDAIDYGDDGDTSNLIDDGGRSLESAYNNDLGISPIATAGSPVPWSSKLASVAALAVDLLILTYRAGMLQSAG